MKTYGIVLLPDAKTEKYIGSLGTRVAGNQIRFGSKMMVHLSLLHVVLPARRLSTLVKAFQEIFLPGAITINCRGILHQKSGWRFVKVRKTKTLRKLQDALLPLTKIRARGTSFTWRAVATAAQKRSYARYGYANVGDAWKVHFTFGRTKSSRSTTQTSVQKRGHAERIALVVMGEHSTAGKIICSRRLTSP